MNQIHRFLFKDFGIRGEHIRITHAWQEMIKDRHYPTVLTQFLGELTAISVMLASGIKHKGKLTLQMMGEGPITLLVVEVTHDLKIKGVAKTKGTLRDEATLEALLGSGQILSPWKMRTPIPFTNPMCLEKAKAWRKLLRLL